MTTEFVRSADGTQIAYAANGSGPPLVFLPGVPFSNLEAEWRIPVLRHAYGSLAAKLRFIQYDGRGTGRSARNVGDLSLGAMVSDLDAVLRATVGQRPATLLGFYHSCAHAIAFAAEHPRRVSRLVLFGGSTRSLDPMSDPSTQALLSLMDRDWGTFADAIAHSWLGWTAGEEGRLAADTVRAATTPVEARATLEAAGAIDVTGVAGRIECPTLVLHRVDASVISLAMSEELAASMPGARLRFLPGPSAGLFFTDIDVVVELLIGFATAGTIPDTIESSSASADLTPRQLEVLRLLAAGETNEGIAGRLGISTNTVERHVANVYGRIDARGRADATAWAVRRGLA
jgi:pimeloyl-ACP methyl ester carboxylesterase/DNA-binding CsgD family transcriptional regulator